VPSLVLHVDMDAFFASVEVRSDPRLAGKALVVGGGPGDRGVVTTASYPARLYGVRSGMALRQARRLCPHLLIVPVTPPKYVHESLAVLAVLDSLSPRVEPASIDEAYLEFPPVPVGLWESRARATSERVRLAVREARSLTCSVGAGVTKLQAKMASSLHKPDGVGLVPPGRFLDVFGDHPVSDIPGVGPKATSALETMGIRTVAELARAPKSRLRSVFGRAGVALSAEARGEDERPVLAAGEEPLPKSAGHETTFARDIRDPDTLRAVVWLLSDRVARRLRRARLRATTVAVRCKVGAVRFSRQRKLGLPTDDPRVLAVTAWPLLERGRRGRALRLVGVAGLGLLDTEGEESLFPSDRRRREFLQVEDRLRDRFGERAVLPAGVFLGEESDT